jgi:hypothetical protein
MWSKDGLRMKINLLMGHSNRQLNMLNIYNSVIWEIMEDYRWLARMLSVTPLRGDTLVIIVLVLQQF